MSTVTPNDRQNAEDKHRKQIRHDRLVFNSFHSDPFICLDLLDVIICMQEHMEQVISKEN